MPVLPAYMFMHKYMPDAQKRALDPMELEIWMHHVGAGIKPGSPGRVTNQCS